MPDVKISDMTPGSALDGTELLEMTQSGDTFSTTPADIRTYAQSLPMDFVGGTQTTDNPVISAAQTWNAGGVTFTAIKLDVTNTASAAASMLIDLQVGAVTQFNVTRGGALTITGAFTAGSTIRTAGFAVGSLPAAGTAGRRAYVTDSNAALTAGIGAIVAGGGANVVPVFDDGTNWRIG